MMNHPPHGGMRFEYAEAVLMFLPFWSCSLSSCFDEKFRIEGSGVEEASVLDDGVGLSLTSVMQVKVVSIIFINFHGLSHCLVGPDVRWSEPGLGWSVWSVWWASFACVTQDAIFCGFICVFFVFSSYFGLVLLKI
jgi:hypothetical protein